MLRSNLESLNLETFPVFGNTSQIHPSKSFNSPLKKQIETHKKLTIFLLDVTSVVGNLHNISICFRSQTHPQTAFLNFFETALRVHHREPSNVPSRRETSDASIEVEGFFAQVDGFLLCHE